MSFKKEVDECIKEFIGEFMKKPEGYINESDIVPHFFKKLYDKIGEKRLYSSNKEIFLLHSEYLTYAKCKKNEKKPYDHQKGNSGYFDLVVLGNDVKEVYDHHKKQPINIAIEFKMNIKPPTGKLESEIFKDIQKIKNPKNKVTNKYFIFVVNNNRYAHVRFKINKGAFLGSKKTRLEKTEAIIDLMKKHPSVKCYYIEYDIPWESKTKKLFTDKKDGEKLKPEKCQLKKYQLQKNVFVFKKDK